MTTESIDDLLVRYLGLLDEYTRLCMSLSTHQTAMYGQLSRANFAAERGFRYGPDHYDGRMRATARLCIADEPSDGAVSFEILRGDKTAEKQTGSSQGESIENKTEDGATAKKTQRPRDPLQWFGVLTPMTLRLAQKEAIEVVGTIIPRLATVRSEMAAVEIAVRRARKKRARAEAARAKEQLEARTEATATATATATA